MLSVLKNKVVVDIGRTFMKRRSRAPTRFIPWEFPMAITIHAVTFNTTLVFLAFLAGSGLEANEPNGFSGTRAMEYLEAICELGPRPVSYTHLTLPTILLV